MEITDSLCFTNSILRETLTAEDKKEIILAAMKLLIDINCSPIKRVGNINNFCRLLFEKILPKIKKYKLPKVRVGSENEAEQIQDRNRQADGLNDILNSIDEKLRVILDELGMIIKLNKLPVDNNYVKTCKIVIGVDVSNSIAHILSKLQIDGFYKDNEGVERNVLDDVFSAKTCQLKRVLLNKNSKIVKDIKGNVGNTYGTVITVPQLGIQMQWHIPDMKISDAIKFAEELYRGKRRIEVWIPQEGESAERARLVARLGVSNDNIIARPISEIFLPWKPGGLKNWNSIKELFATCTRPQQSWEEISGGGNYGEDGDRA